MTLNMVIEHLSLVVASLMNRWGEDILPEEVAYTMFDGATNGVHNAAYAVAAAASCGYPAWQAWLDLKELRAQIHDGCSVGVEMETRLSGQKEPVRVWMALRGFGHDEDILAKLESGEVQPEGLGIGMRNIHKRVQYAFSDRYGLQVKCQDGWTRIIVHLPEKRL